MPIFGSDWRARLTSRFRVTPEGGYAIRLINKTGAASVKGTIVVAADNADSAFKTAPANSPAPYGAVYESGIADGEPCFVVVGGIADVLLKDGTAATRGNWVGVSDTAGRAYATDHPGSVPPEAAVHSRELGHCIENKDAGVGVLAKIVMHFN
jgi:hypothetical protein